MAEWHPNLPDLVPRLPDDHPGAPRGAGAAISSGPNSTPEGYARCKKQAQEAIRSVTDAIVAADEASAEKGERIFAQCGTKHPLIWPPRQTPFQTPS